jgi:hypothetical protein
MREPKPLWRYILMRLVSWGIPALGVAYGGWYTYTYQSWLSKVEYAAMRDHGTQAIARITSEEYGNSQTPYYAVALSWHDKAGNERHSGQIHVSYGFHFGSRINTRSDQATILYLEDDPSVPPVILDDLKEREWLVVFSDILAAFGVLWGIVLTVAMIGDERDQLPPGDYF